LIHTLITINKLYNLARGHQMLGVPVLVFDPLAKFLSEALSIIGPSLYALTVSSNS